MQSPASEICSPPSSSVTLRLLVRNHSGVMSHICGLFARRTFNLDGILCLPVGDGARSSVVLWVRDDARLEQVVRQLAKLEDVLSVQHEPGGVEMAGSRSFGAGTMV